MKYFSIQKSIQEEKPPAEIVRLETSYWMDKRRKGIHEKRSLLFMKRLSKISFNVLEEDTNNAGAEEIIPRILNLNECEDGLYQVVLCNPIYDWETGHLEDYDYKLVPYSEEGPNN
jgi:hypothetical protein